MNDVVSPIVFELVIPGHWVCQACGENYSSEEKLQYMRMLAEADRFLFALNQKGYCLECAAEKCFGAIDIKPAKTAANSSGDPTERAEMQYHGGRFNKGEW